MRGDHARLPAIVALARKYDERFAENVLVVVDDSHSVGACGATGRRAGSGPVDVLVATLGKALGANGGYCVASRVLTSTICASDRPAGEAAAAVAALAVHDSPAGRTLLAYLRRVTARIYAELVKLGYETVAGAHPVMPLMVRDTGRTQALVQHLKAHRHFPVVPAALRRSASRSPLTTPRPTSKRRWLSSPAS